MKGFKFSLFFLMALGLLFTSIGCDDDDTPEPISILSITAEGTDLQTGNQVEKDLNAATAPTDVPLDAIITITFAREVDPTTVNSTTINLTQDGSAVPANVAAAGSVVTMTPDKQLERGLVYTLNITSGVAAADGGQFAQSTRTFTAAGRADVTPPQAASQLAYWKMNGDAASESGEYDGDATAVDFTEDRFGNQNSAGLFDGDASIVEVADGDKLYTDKTSFTWSYWIFVDTVGHVGGHFVMGLGNTSGFFNEIFGNVGGMKMNMRYTRPDGTTQSNDFFFNGDGMSADAGGWVGVEFEKDLAPTGGLAALLAQKWAHVVWMYDGATNKRHLYINGELMETDNLNNAPALADLNGVTFDPEANAPETIGDNIAFGFLHDRATTKWMNEPWGGYQFPDANHFKGALDDIRLFEAALSANEVKSLYDAEKP